MSGSRRFIKHIRPAVLAVLIVCVLAASLAGLASAQSEPAPAAEPAASWPAQDGGGEDETGEADAGSSAQAPSTCAECHPDVTHDWQGGPHDLAFSNEHFHESWLRLDSDTACLDCHTTGFSPATGTFAAEGVTCEACHGEVTEDHPPAPVDLNRANEVCGSCHTVTQAEFRASMHADAGLECTSCHYAHTNGLRMENELQQCLNCHADELDGFVAHEVHIQNDVSCRDCHGYVTPGHPIPDDGLAPTGHDFQENITACLHCHEDIELAPVNGARAEAGEDGDEPDKVTADLGGREARLRARQLEAAVQTLLLQQRNRTTMNIVEGAAGGLLIGGVAVYLISRRRNGNGNGKGKANKQADK